MLVRRRPAPAGTVEIGHLRIEADAVGDAFWVVDGQQRGTSLVGALTAGDDTVDPRFRVYFDLAREVFISLPEQGSGLRNLVGRELGRSSPHDFQVLLYLGEDLPGNVRVVLESDTPVIPESAVEPHDDGLGMVRFSLAGVQAEFSMRWEGKGLVLPMSGQGGDWIVKLPDRRFPEVPANEHAILTWAKLVGIDVPEIRLIEGTHLTGLPDGLVRPDEMVFAVRRFDRLAGGRVHQEDFAQVREVAVASPGAPISKPTR
ncbi:type II toxin-antitoxin system HipA family toxin [Nonomuraea maheshkhaliensis]|uniref:type II toxin-antitoxin system HipA family toxin n=1 Tax=Nonomuraea maheshkhaliensis TaxID=419590 RepID=UPI0031F828A5